MKKRRWLSLFSLLMILPGGFFVGPKPAVSTAPGFGKTPLYFIRNCGQTDPQALYYAKTFGYTLLLTKKGLVFDFSSTAGQDERDPSRGHLSSLVFRDANPDAELIALEPADYKVHYFLGNDPSRWRRDVPTSLAVLYKEIYPGIDLKVYGKESRVEYDWIIKPGGRVDAIQLECRDGQDAHLDAEGHLVVATGAAEVVHRKPSSYQRGDGKEWNVDSRFARLGPNRFGFEVEGFREGFDLIIDPLILVFSTYLGGNNKDLAYGIAVDKTGAVYVTGYTGSPNFPVRNGFQGQFKGGFKDVFLTKFTPAGNALAFSTYLGGSDYDQGLAVAVDGTGAAYITGSTSSDDFPLQNPFQGAEKGGGDAFAAKLAPAGNALVFSTFLGGKDSDRGQGIAVDGSGAVYITGDTMSSDFPLQNPFQSVHNAGYSGLDAFVSKLAPQGNALVFSTFLGGQGVEHGNGIAVDGSGAAYVTGRTETYGFPVLNPYQGTAQGRTDAYLVKLTPAGNALVFSTFLGGNSDEEGFGVAVDGSGAAVVTGTTLSTNFPLRNPVQNRLMLSYDAFVTKFTTGGNDLVFSTFLGGKGDDEGRSIALSAAGAPCVTGWTKSSNFPLAGAFQKSFGGYADAFVAQLTAPGTALAFSSYLGGQGEDIGTGVAVDAKGAVYIAGSTKSTDFPLQKPFQKTISPYWYEDAFMAKLVSGSLTVTSPKGGETWKAASVRTIKWTYAGSIGSKVKIELLKGGRLDRVIAAGAPIGTAGRGSFKWTLPANQASGTSYKIRITSREVPACLDLSDRSFAIVK